MSKDRVRDLTNRADLIRKRLHELRKRSRDNAQRLSDVSGEILSRISRLDDAALAVLDDLDPAAHAKAFRDAMQDRMESFQADFDRVAQKALALPERIKELASGETLETVEQSLSDLRDEVLEILDGVARNVEDSLVTDAFVYPSKAIMEEFEASAGMLREIAAEMTVRLESLGESMVEMAEGVKEVAENAGDTLTEGWTNRAEIMEGIFEGHTINMSARVKALENRFEALRDRLITTFAAVSALRSDLTDLSVDNAGPTETLAEALSAASETLGAVG